MVLQQLTLFYPFYFPYPIPFQRNNISLSFNSMATNLMQPPITASYYNYYCYSYYSVPKQSSKIQHPLISPKKSTPKLNSTRFLHFPSSQFSLTLACTSEEHNSTVLVNDNDIIALTKASVYNALEEINRGVFGVTSSKKKEIEDLVIQLEANNPTPNPTTNLDKVSGWWKLVYSTITILGSKRTKLGLRDFINLGDFLQMIDVAEGKAVNIVKFSSRGLNLLNGQLTIQASFSVASPSRVDIKYDDSQITPEQLMNLFKKNYELLLSIFNPEGWLEITYVDDTMRIGRDDKGNIFILERCTDTDQL